MNFRVENDAPQNETEQRIQDILLENGYEEGEIQFRQREDNCYHLRIGYWDRLDSKSFSQLSHIVEEESDYDEDCGYKFCYTFKQPFVK